MTQFCCFLWLSVISPLWSKETSRLESAHRPIPGHFPRGWTAGAGKDKQRLCWPAQLWQQGAGVTLLSNNATIPKYPFLTRRRARLPILLSYSFFLTYFIVKIFKHREKLKGLDNEHLCIWLNSTDSILLHLFYHLSGHLSIQQLI